MRSICSVLAILLLAATAHAQQKPVPRKSARVRRIEAPAPPVIFKYVEQQAAFPGDLHEYVRSKLRYPSDAREYGAEGRAVVLFEITAEGRVRFIRMQRSSGVPSLDAEAERLVRGMPAWKPGKVQGTPRRTLMLLPVMFKLD